MTIPHKTLIGATLASLCMWAGFIQITWSAIKWSMKFW